MLNRYCYKHIFYNDDETIGENYSKLFLLEGSDEFRRKKFKEQIKREIQENDSIIDDGFSGIEKEICSVCHKIEDKRKGQYNDDAFFCSDCNGLLKLNLVFKKIDEKFKIGLLDKDHLFNFEDINLLSYWKELDSININKIEPPFEIIPLGYPLKDSDSEIVPFSELAERSSGGKRLAALKLDVDNLGNIFTKGIKEMTFSKYYQLSMMLDFFFKGIVQELRNQDEYKDYIYIIFSGGDDAFFIGSWDKVLMFAFDLYKLFKNYSGNNPYVNISASYFMFDESYPVFKVYKDSEELLEKAKENGKNKINVNGLLLNWSQVSELKNKLFSNEYNFNVSDNEVELFVNLVNLFYSLVEQAIIGRSLLSNWYYLTKESIELSEVNVPKVWMFKYSITRNVKNKDLQEDLWNLFKEYFSKVMSENLNKKILLYALKIVLFYTREVKK